MSFVIILLMVLGSFGAVGTNLNPSDNNEFSPTNCREGFRKALIVGIADYPGGGDLQYTDDDAIEIKEVLESNGWDEGDITLFIDDEGTKSGITEELNDIADTTNANSISLFFFSGHGTQDGQGEALCCYGTGSSSYLYDFELNDILDNFNGKVVVIIDSCHSGGMEPPDFGNETEFNTSEYINNFIETLGAGNENRVILMACAADEYSYETSELQNGVFSFFIIEGLWGLADEEGDGNGIITAEETFSYAEPKTTDYEPRQHPKKYDGDTSTVVPIIGGAIIEGIDLTFTMYKINQLDEIDPLPFDEADWYYNLRLFTQDGNYVFTKSTENKDTWTPNKEYIVEVIDSTVEIQIKLMEDDALIGDDLADVSSYEGGGEDNWTPEKRGAIYHGTYNLITNQLTGDTTINDGGYKKTSGEYDNNAGGEPDDGNDAEVWFKITDEYNPNNPKYDPKLSVDPTSFYFGNVAEGDVVEEELFIINTAEPDPFNQNPNLNWEINKPSWIDVSQSSGSLDGGTQKKIIVTIDTEGMQHKKWEGNLEVTSNGGNKEIPISINVPRAKSHYSLFYEILENILVKLPFLSNFFP